jgi:hypothetical protein
MNALRAADVTVLVLPCGRSAHLELGYATGAGQLTLVLFADTIDEPELMYLMNTRICTSVDEVVANVTAYRAERGAEASLRRIEKIRREGLCPVIPSRA